MNVFLLEGSERVSFDSNGLAQLHHINHRSIGYTLLAPGPAGPTATAMSSGACASRGALFSLKGFL